jgi:hypothetical protein
MSDFGQIIIHTAEPVVPETSPFEVEIFIETLKGINLQVLIKFLQNRFKQEIKHYSLAYIISLILFGIRKNCLSCGGSLLYQFTRRASDKIALSNYGGTSLFPTS